MAGILGRIPGRHIPSRMPFRPARNMPEAMRMQDALDYAVASGNDAAAREIAAAIRASGVDAEGVGIRRALRSLEREPMEVLPERTFEDMAQDIDQSVRSHDWMRSGRGRLKNQWRGDIAGSELRAAAEEAIRSRQQAAASENLGRSVALLGAGGLAGMIADTAGRMQSSPPGIRDMGSEAMDEPMADLPEIDPSPLPMPEIDEPTISDITFEDPMDTADLVAESRPIPDSTPMALIRENMAEEAARSKMTAEQFIAQVSADMKSQIAQLNDLRRKRAITPEQDRMLSQEIARMVDLVNEARAPSRMR